MAEDMKSDDSPRHECLIFRGGDSWAAEDLAEFLRDLYVLYNRSVVLREHAATTAGGLVGQLYGSKARVEDDDKLMIDWLVMRSPIEVNFKGLGGPIRQVRELIKDLSGRNRLERARLEEDLIHERAMNRIEEQRGNLDLLVEAAGACDRLGADPSERRAIIKAFTTPAVGVAEIMQTKQVLIAKAGSDQTSGPKDGGN